VNDEGNQYVKIRAIFPYPPEVHTKNDCILWALAAKEIVCDALNQSAYEAEGKPTLFIRVPKKGTNSEIAQILNEMPKGLLSMIAGDDSLDALRTTNGKMWTTAADLESCDTTLGELIEPVLKALTSKGLPDVVADHVRDTCTGPFTFEHHDTDEHGDPLFYKVVVRIMRINGSGHSLTTLLTVLVNASIKLRAWELWNGEPPTWPRALRAACAEFGTRVSIEDHGNDGMNPIGMDTFLSCVPMREKKIGKLFSLGGEYRFPIVAIPKGHIKALFIKGVRGELKGKTNLAGIAARARDPAFTHTWMGMAMRGAMCRFLVGKPVPPEEGEPKNPYKLRYEELEEPLIDMSSELAYYQQFGDFTMADFVFEMANWSRVEEFPVTNVGNQFRILAAVARAQYGLG